jgi:MYXO-CTERM domain-containing protein
MGSGSSGCSCTFGPAGPNSDVELPTGLLSGLALAVFVLRRRRRAAGEGALADDQRI